MKKRYKIAIIIIIIIFRAPNLFSDETKQEKKSFFGLTQENKVVPIVTSFFAFAQSLFEEMQSDFVRHELEARGVQVWNDKNWKLTDEYLDLAKKLGVNESTLKRQQNELRSQRVNRFIGRGGVAVFLGVLALDYLGYIPHATEKQEKLIPETPTASSPNPNNQSATAQ